MPLGDSITVGKYSGPDRNPGADNDDIGYREDLYDQLIAGGYYVDNVGTNSNGSFGEPQHEGHNGWQDDQIAANIYDNGENWLSQNPADVILLHIGTNSLDSDESYVEDILDEIDFFESDTGGKVVVIVARIIDQVPNNSTINSFNNAVESMVTGRSDYGSMLFMVDMEDGAGLNYSIWPGDPSGDMIDILHPYASGYTKMASIWYSKYDEIFSSAPPNTAPNITNPGNKTDPENSLISWQITALDPDVESITYTAYNLPPGLSINATTGWITGTITGTASSGSPYDVQIVITDGNLCGNTSISFTWNITEVNFPPVIQTTVDDRTDDEGDYVEIPITATDHNDTDLTYSANNLPPGININQNTGLISGVIGYSASEQAQFPNFPVEITVEDDGNPPMEDSISFTWTVYDVVTDAPVVNNPGNQKNKPGEIISLQIIASDPEGEDISFVAQNLPSNLEINLVSGEITGEIAEFAILASPYNVTVTVTDESANSTQIDFTWFVFKEELHLPLVINK